MENDSSNIMNKMKLLRERLLGTDRDDHLDIINNWENDAKRAMFLDNLQEHEGIRIIKQHISDDIARVNNRLANEKSDKLTDSQRDALIDVRDYMSWFLDLFTASKSTLKDIEETVDKELADDNEDVV